MGLVTPEGLYTFVLFVICMIVTVSVIELVPHLDEQNRLRSTVRGVAVLSAMVTVFGFLLLHVSGYILGANSSIREPLQAELYEITRWGFLTRAYHGDAGKRVSWISEVDLHSLYESESIRSAVENNSFPFDVNSHFDLNGSHVRFEELPAFIKQLYIPELDVSVYWRKQDGILSGTLYQADREVQRFQHNTNFQRDRPHARLCGSLLFLLLGIVLALYVSSLLNPFG